MQNFKIKYLKLKSGKSPLTDWLDSLDSVTRKRINQRILRIEEGNFGDYKQITDEIFELRYNFGSGYRIYYTKIENIIILLINGGDKSTQSKDIKNAQKFLDNWRKNNE